MLVIADRKSITFDPEEECEVHFWFRVDLTLVNPSVPRLDVLDVQSPFVTRLGMLDREARVTRECVNRRRQDMQVPFSYPRHLKK